MRFWKRDLNLAGTVMSGRKSKQTAGEQRVIISRERVSAEYNFAGTGLKSCPAQTSNITLSLPYATSSLKRRTRECSFREKSLSAC